MFYVSHENMNWQNKKSFFIGMVLKKIILNYIKHSLNKKQCYCKVFSVQCVLRNMCTVCSVVQWNYTNHTIKIVSLEILINFIK